MTNPYSPPTEPSARDADSRLAIRSRVSRPATALIVMSSIQSVLVAIYIVPAVVVAARGGSTSDDYIALAIACLQFVVLILIAIGGAKLAFLESYWFARLGALLACIPIITPFMILGLPFGVWSLRLLADPSVRSAFPDAVPQPHADG